MRYMHLFTFKIISEEEYSKLPPNRKKMYIPEHKFNANYGKRAE